MAKEKTLKAINIVNRKAKFEYEFVDSYEAGIVLTGTEIKSIRVGKANISDAFCTFQGTELVVRGMHITEYEYGTYNNHDPLRVRKLLLHKSQLNKMARKVTEKGMTVVPYRLYISERGLAKLEIMLAQGKKSFDKRDTIKERDNKRDLDRLKKIYM